KDLSDDMKKREPETLRQREKGGSFGHRQREKGGSFGHRQREKGGSFGHRQRKGSCGQKKGCRVAASTATRQPFRLGEPRAHWSSYPSLRGSLGFAKFTFRLRPSRAVSFRALMAASASGWLAISMNPKPFDLPVCRSLMTLLVSTFPKGANN